MMVVWIFALVTALSIGGSLGQGRPDDVLGELHNTQKVCTADTSDYVRRGTHLRMRGARDDDDEVCLQGYTCDGAQIIQNPRTCPQGTYYSVHVGTCAWSNLSPGANQHYTDTYGSFNCIGEQDDENLNYDTVTEKRMRACAELMAQDEPTQDLYAGHSSHCRIMFKCPNVAEHDDWYHYCLRGYMFGFDEQGFGPCILADSSCTE